VSPPEAKRSPAAWDPHPAAGAAARRWTRWRLLGPGWRRRPLRLPGRPVRPEPSRHRGYPDSGNPVSPFPRMARSSRTALAVSAQREGRSGGEPAEIPGSSTAPAHRRCRRVGAGDRDRRRCDGRLRQPRRRHPAGSVAAPDHRPSPQRDGALRVPQGGNHHRPGGRPLHGLHRHRSVHRREGEHGKPAVAAAGGAPVPVAGAIGTAGAAAPPLSSTPDPAPATRAAVSPELPVTGPVAGAAPARARRKRRDHPPAPSANA
jgi:hypothetical protein